MKVMICQPMVGKTEEEIFDERCKATEELYSSGYDVVNSLFDFDEDILRAIGVKNVPLYYLAKSLEAMSHCDAVYFCEGWQHARGCRIERAAAVKYGLTVIDRDEIPTQPKEDAK